MEEIKAIFVDTSDSPLSTQSANKSYILKFPFCFRNQQMCNLEFHVNFHDLLSPNATSAQTWKQATHLRETRFSPALLKETITCDLKE